MGWHASSSLVLLVLLAGSIAVPALAEQHWTPPYAPEAAALAARPEAAAFRAASTAVAAFPDVVPERPKPPVDPALELLATDPYEAELMARKIAMNLFAARPGPRDGEDAALDDPYAEELRLANPYTDDIRLASPYPDTARLDNPYSDTLLLEDPYRRERR
jgi:hypothetical protein